MVLQKIKGKGKKEDFLKKAHKKLYKLILASNFHEEKFKTLEKEKANALEVAT
jgi:hypothetical protein